KQQFAEVLVGRDMARIDGQDVGVRSLRCAAIALLLEEDAEIEIRVDEVGTQGERTLIGARRAGGVAHALQGDTMTEVRVRIRGNEHQKLPERSLRLRAIAAPN